MCAALGKRPRTLDKFFKSPNSKRARDDSSLPPSIPLTSDQYSKHETYPWSIPHLPYAITEPLGFAPETEGRVINDQPDLDLVYYQPYIPAECEEALFRFLRANLFFYRVCYTIKRGPNETQIRTPRYTTVFGVDDTSRFASSTTTITSTTTDDDGNASPPVITLVDAATGRPIPKGTKYKAQPRPPPQCLDYLRTLVQNTTGHEFNHILVNYYADGQDSISYHSDDERFLHAQPAIASLTLGARRDFLLKHKPYPAGKDPSTPGPADSKPLKFPLASGDMLLMRGRTQGNWLHSIPKRKGGDAEKGRINITLRRARIPYGTDNYLQYNVGTGPAFRWNEDTQCMEEWKGR